MDTNPQQVPRIDYPSPDPAKLYVYPDTQILINRFGIRSMPVLQRVVDTVTGLRGDQLRDDPVVDEHDLRHLREIRRALLQDIFA